jgi:hypothetical protein
MINHQKDETTFKESKENMRHEKKTNDELSIYMMRKLPNS